MVCRCFMHDVFVGICWWWVGNILGHWEYTGLRFTLGKKENGNPQKGNQAKLENIRTT